MPGRTGCLISFRCYNCAMTERVVTIGVNPQVMREVAAYKRMGDPINEEMVQTTVEDVVDELHFLGAIDKKEDVVKVVFVEDKNVPVDSTSRIVTVGTPVMDEYGETEIGVSEQIYTFDFDIDLGN